LTDQLVAGRRSNNISSIMRIFKKGYSPAGVMVRYTAGLLLVVRRHRLPMELCWGIRVNRRRLLLLRGPLPDSIGIHVDFVNRPLQIGLYTRSREFSDCPKQLESIGSSFETMNVLRTVPEPISYAGFSLSTGNGPVS
jgi:hypothetical protein